MNMRCEFARELIPDLVGGRLAAEEAARVGSHLETCDACRAEADFVRLLFASRPVAPRELVSRVREAVRAGEGSARRPWWGLAAAAVAVLALGIGVASRGATEATAPVPGFVAEGTAVNVWFADDGMIAGAPALDGLSDDALQALLDELGSGGTGGTA
ncbi:MAG: zf-HC2 domain-containing protein [Gemmatimonadetes bacterium]|nr:zf-HC2 domain-containing protein [Gemmatimonadota bacterium]